MRVRTICVPRPSPTLPSGRPEPVSRTCTVSVVGDAVGGDLDVALLAGEPVLDGVRDQLGERERERRRVLARQHAEASPGASGARVRVVRGGDLGDEQQRPVEDLVEVDVLRRVPRESVSCTTAIGADAPHRLA